MTRTPSTPSPLEIELVDSQTQLEVPISQHLKQRITRPLPAVSLMPEPKATSNLSESNWLWPTIIIFSAVAAGLVYFVFTDTIVRPALVFWFLFVCPGMMVVRFLHLKDLVVEWTIALALSFAIDALVAGNCMLENGHLQVPSVY